MRQVIKSFGWKQAAGAEALVGAVGEVTEAIDGKDLDTFEKAFKISIERANFYHEERGKPYLVWKLPATPPPDLDLEPRQKK